MSSTGIVYTDMNQNVASSLQNVTDLETAARVNKYVKQNDLHFCDILTGIKILLWLQKVPQSVSTGISTSISVLNSMAQRPII